jgi:hypothetical protein
MGSASRAFLDFVYRATPPVGAAPRIDPGQAPLRLQGLPDIEYRAEAALVETNRTCGRCVRAQGTHQRVEDKKKRGLRRARAGPMRRPTPLSKAAHRVAKVAVN